MGGAALGLAVGARAKAGPSRAGHILAIGDSIIEQNFFRENMGFANPAANARVYADSRGQIHWALALLGGGIHTTEDNFGLGGSTTGPASNPNSALARLPQLLARASQVNVAAVILNPGTNDFFNGLAPSDTLANLQSIVTQLIARGLFVIWLPILPRSTFSAAQQRQAADLNNKMMAWCVGMYGVRFVDDLNWQVDGATGNPRANVMQTDGIHPDMLGAYRRAKYGLVPALQPILQPYNRLASGMDAVDASDAVTGNLIGKTQGLFIGTGGTVSAPVTGDLAPNWSSSLAAGTISSGTITLSQAAREDGLGSNQVLTLSGLQSNANSALIGIRRTITVNDTTVSAGDILEAWAEVNVAGGSTNLRGVVLECTEEDGSGTLGTYRWNSSGLASAWPTDAMRLVLSTPRFAIRPSGGAGTRRVIVGLYAFGDGTGPGGISATVSFGRAALRKVL